MNSDPDPDLDADLDTMSPAELVEEVKQLRAAIREHRDALRNPVGAVPGTA